DPLRAGRHTDLVSHGIIANCSSDRVGPMTNIVTRKRRIVSARICNAVMNRIMPVVVMISGDAIPASVVRLERVMSPALPRVSAADRDTLASEPQRPHIRRMCISYAGLDCRRGLRLRGGSNNGVRLRKDISNVWIAF